MSPVLFRAFRRSSIRRRSDPESLARRREAAVRVTDLGYKDAIRAAPRVGFTRRRVAILLVLQVGAVAFEGLGISMLLPVFQFMQAGEAIEYGSALGQWKDECGGVPIVRVCCLGPKTYAYLRADGVSVVKSKGFSAPFTLAQYEEAAAAYFVAQDPARGTAPGKAQALRLTQPDIRFVRRLGEGIKVIPAEKTMLPLMDKLVVVSPSLTLPRGHRDCPAT